jgi:diguanylate cyclase (GGDEF)-like protein
MRRILFKTSIICLLTAIIVMVNFFVLPMKESMELIDIAGESIIVVMVLFGILLMHKMRARKIADWVLFAGLAIYFVSALMDLSDEIFFATNAHTYLAYFENIFMPAGMITIAFGLWLMFRDQRQTQKVLEENNKEFETLSITDGLTGLFNSRYFYEILQKEAQRAIRYHRPLSMLLLDIDNFKSHNDVYGHIEGDKVLRRLGRLITSLLRENDSGYRYGGEEFTIILPETAGDKANIVAERIRSDFEEIIFIPQSSGDKVSKTLSVGVTEYNMEEDISSFIRRADHAMYSAKKAGKNQVAKA